MRRDTAGGGKTMKNAPVDTTHQKSVIGSRPVALSKSVVSASNGGESAESKASRNVTFMLIMTSFLYVAGNVPFLVGNTAAYLKVSTYFSYWFTITLLNIYPGLKIFVYYLFNKQYRCVLNKYVKCQFT